MEIIDGESEMEPMTWNLTKAIVHYDKVMFY